MFVRNPTIEQANCMTGTGRRSRGFGQEAVAHGHLLYRVREERTACLRGERLGRKVKDGRGERSTDGTVMDSYCTTSTEDLQIHGVARETVGS